MSIMNMPSVVHTTESSVDMILRKSELFVLEQRQAMKGELRVELNGHVITSCMIG